MTYVLLVFIHLEYRLGKYAKAKCTCRCIDCTADSIGLVRVANEEPANCFLEWEHYDKQNSPASSISIIEDGNQKDIGW